MAEDFRMVADFADSPKIKKLVIRLGEPAFRCWVRLLGYVRMNRPNGRLRNMDDLDIAAAASWNDDPKDFVQALIEIRLLDRAKNGSYKVHNWAKYNVYAIDAEKRRRQAQLAARARWNKGHNNLNARSSDAPAMRQHKKSNALPDQSRPVTTSHGSIRPDQSRNEVYDRLRDLYIEICQGFPEPTEVSDWSQKRKGSVNARWKAHPDLDWWRAYFERIAKSDILKNGYSTWPGADLGWVILPSNMEKILEGRYDNKKEKRGQLTSEKDYGPEGGRPF